jgi:hypothetical protein
VMVQFFQLSPYGVTRADRTITTYFVRDPPLPVLRRARPSRRLHCPGCMV